MSTPTSSSAAATKIRSPPGSKPSRASEAIATALAATSPFMSRAPRPQISPSRNSARPRIDLPFARIGVHRVGVREESEARPVAAARDPGDEVGALRHLCVELASDPALREVVAEELGRPRLVPGRVHRVEADELLEELGRLVAEREWSPRSSVESILLCCGQPVLGCGQRAAAGDGSAGHAHAAPAARGFRRPGAGARRALGPAARDRGGPRGLLDPLRAAGQREDHAREGDREHDRRGLRGAVGRVRDGRPGARGAQGRPGAAGRPRPADDPLPRRDPPVQQGAAGRAAAGGRGGNGDADRRDDREPVLRGQLGAALAEPDLRARAAHGRGAGD